MNIKDLHKSFFLFVALLFSSSCSLEQSDWCQETEVKLSWLRSADPISDAKTAIENNNKKYVAVYGFSIEIPGISEEESFEAYSNNNYEAIEGTGDDLCSEEHAELTNMAREYASNYNKTLAEAP